MRPRTIIWFEDLLITSLLGPLLHLAAFWQEIRAGVIPPRDVAVTLLLTVAIPLVLALRASRYRSVIAKWMLVALLLIGLPGWFLRVSFQEMPVLLLGLGIVTALLQTAAVALLFTASARQWLGRTDAPPDLRQTFE